MATTAKGPLMLSLRPRLIPTTCMATATQLTAMATTARGPLMLSLRPRLIPTTCTATATQLTDMADIFMERGPLMPSQKPSQMPSLTCTTATRLTAMATAMAMATERGLLKLSPRPTPTTCPMARIPSLRLCLRKVTCQSRTCPYEILVYHRPQDAHAWGLQVSRALAVHVTAEADSAGLQELWGNNLDDRS